MNMNMRTHSKWELVARRNVLPLSKAAFMRSWELFLCWVMRLDNIQFSGGPLAYEIMSHIRELVAIDASFGRDVLALFQPGKQAILKSLSPRLISK